MPLQPDHLLTLAAISRTGSLTRAAALLGKTQPAISTQIKQLSSYVGEPVVNRHRHGVTLTPGGNALLPAAQEAARALDNAEQVVKRLQGNEISELRIASATSIAVYLLPLVLAFYRDRFPKIDVRLEICSADEAVDRLARNDADLALIRGPITRLAKSVASRTVIDDETVLAVRADHDFAKRRRIRMTDMAGLDVVRQGSGSATQSMIDQLAEENALEFNTTFDAPSVDAVKEAVLQGLGAGFLSRFAIARECANGSLNAIRISDANLKRPVMLLYPQTPQLSPRVRGFFEIMKAAKLGGRK